MILRGLSGAGKTTYALRLMKKLNSMFGLRVIKCSADDYFTDNDGNYNFNAAKLGSAHGYCKYEAARACRSGNDLVVIDNTNVRHKDIKPYKDIAKEYDYRVVVRVIGNQDDESIKLYAERNAHNVPLYVIERAAKRFAK